MSDEECGTVNIEAAAKRLGISVNSARKAAACGELPVIRLGRRVLVSRSVLDRMLAGRTSGAGSD